MKKNNKGFTLVELIVVLVILAILAAILVPALLGWIDKAREKSVTSNAEAAYVAAQGLITEQYGTLDDPMTNCTIAKIDDLAEIEETFSAQVSLQNNGWAKKSTASRNMYKIKAFAYYSNDAKKWAVWEGGNWTVTKTAPKLAKTISAGTSNGGSTNGGDTNGGENSNP